MSPAPSLVRSVLLGFAVAAPLGPIGTLWIIVRDRLPAGFRRGVSVLSACLLGAFGVLAIASVIRR